MRKAILLVLLTAVLLAAGAPVVADGCDPTIGDACEMPDHGRWRAVDVDYLPLVARAPVVETEMVRP